MTDRRGDARAGGAPTAQTGAADVALFGAVPLAFAADPAGAAPAMTIGHAPAAAGSDDPGHPGRAEVAEADTVALHGARVADLSLGDVHAGSSAPSHAVPIGSSAGAGTIQLPVADAAAAPHAGSHIATFVSSVVPHAMSDVEAGAGSVEAPAAPPATAPSSAPPVDDALATIRATAASLHDAIASLADRLQTADGGHDATDIAAAIGSDLATVQDQVDGVLGQVDQAVTAATDHVAGGVAAIGNDLAGVQQQVGGVLDQVDHTVAAATDHVAAIGEPVGDLAAGLDETVRTVAEALPDAGSLVSAVVDSTDDIAATLPTDHLDDLAGTNPAGGVATLVGMVSAADAFDLHDAPVAADFAPALGALGSVDLLAEVAPAEALLGVHDGHDGAMGGLTDSLHDGVFGHG